MQMINVLIADDNAEFIQSVIKILADEQDITVIGEAQDGREALLKTKTLQPDVVLMDVRMPRMNGLKATTCIRQVMPETKVIILTIFDIDEYREAAKTSGAFGFILKKSIRSELIQTIREAFESRNT